MSGFLKQGKIAEAAALQVATPASLASSLAAAVAAVNSPSLVTLTSQKGKRDSKKSAGKEDAATSTATVDAAKTTQTVLIASKASSGDSVATVSKTSESKENQKEPVKKEEEENIREVNESKDKQEDGEEEIVPGSVIGILKTDHSYFKSSNGEEKPTVSVPVAKPPEAPNIEGDNADGGSSTKLRGVGLTPPPESELSQFVPTDESEMQQESFSALTVSNVITVPVVSDQGTPSPPNIPNKELAVLPDEDVGKDMLPTEKIEEKAKEYQVENEDVKISMEIDKGDVKKTVSTPTQETVRLVPDEESKTSEVCTELMVNEKANEKRTECTTSENILPTPPEDVPSESLAENDKSCTDIELTSEQQQVQTPSCPSMAEITEKSSLEDGKEEKASVESIHTHAESSQEPSESCQLTVETLDEAATETPYEEGTEMNITKQMVVEISSVEQKQDAFSSTTVEEEKIDDVTAEESKPEEMTTEDNISKDSDQTVDDPQKKDSQIETSTLEKTVEQPLPPEEDATVPDAGKDKVDAMRTKESAVIEPFATASIEIKATENTVSNDDIASNESIAKNSVTELPPATSSPVPVSTYSTSDLIPKSVTSSQENCLELAETVEPTHSISSTEMVHITTSSSTLPAFQATDSAESSLASTVLVHSRAMTSVEPPADVSMTKTQTSSENASASNLSECPQTTSSVETVISAGVEPEQVLGTALVSTYTLATSTAVTPATVPAVVPMPTVSQLTSPNSVTPTTQPVTISSQSGSGTSTNTSPQNLLKKKHLLIKEQPLLLQELLEEEKREQERAR